MFLMKIQKRKLGDLYKKKRKNSKFNKSLPLSHRRLYGISRKLLTQLLVLPTLVCTIVLQQFHPELVPPSIPKMETISIKLSSNCRIKKKLHYHYLFVSHSTYKVICFSSVSKNSWTNILSKAYKNIKQMSVQINPKQLRI